jgi:hypothetical protein
MTLENLLPPDEFTLGLCSPEPIPLEINLPRKRRSENPIPSTLNNLGKPLEKLYPPVQAPEPTEPEHLTTDLEIKRPLTRTENLTVFIKEKSKQVGIISASVGLGAAGIAGKMGKWTFQKSSDLTARLTCCFDSPYAKSLISLEVATSTILLAKTMTSLLAEPITNTIAFGICGLWTAQTALKTFRLDRDLQQDAIAETPANPLQQPKDLLSKKQPTPATNPTTLTRRQAFLPIAAFFGIFFGIEPLLESSKKASSTLQPKYYLPPSWEEATYNSWVNGVELDPYTKGDCQRVSEWSTIAKKAAEKTKTGFDNPSLESHDSLASLIQKRWKLDPTTLILAIIMVESKGKPDAISNNQCSYGLMQVVPRENVTPTGYELLDPETNIVAGCRCMMDKFQRYPDNSTYALQAYNYDWGGTYAEYGKLVLATYYLLLGQNNGSFIVS